jgi:thiol:disulfide interchange protein
MAPVPTWPVAGGSFVLGFAAAEATGVRALGGLVLLAGAGWCAVRWRRRLGAAPAVALLAVCLAAFVGSHLVADTLGKWGAVFAAAAVAAGIVAAAERLTPRGQPRR